MVLLAAFVLLAQAADASPANLLARVRLLTTQQKFDPAIGLLESEIAKQPQRPEFRVLRGDVELIAGRRAVALEDFRGALALMDAKSLSDLQLPSLADDPNLPRGAAGVYLRIAVAESGEGNLKDAVIALRTAKELAPGNAVILTDLAMELEKNGDKTAAMGEYRAALQINPDNPVALNNLAFLIADSGGDLQEALRMARLAKQNQPGSDDVADTVGWIALKVGYTDDAIGTFLTVVSHQPGNSTFRQHLAEAIARKSERTPELSRLSELLRAQPTEENQQAVLDAVRRIGSR